MTLNDAFTMCHYPAQIFTLIAVCLVSNFCFICVHYVSLRTPWGLLVSKIKPDVLLDTKLACNEDIIDYVL